MIENERILSYFQLIGNLKNENIDLNIKFFYEKPSKLLLNS